MDYPRDQAVSWEVLTADAVLSRGPCWFCGIIVTDNAGAVTSVYDGLNANGRLALVVRTVGGVAETVPVELTKPLYFQRGLFVDVPVAVDAATVMWIPVAGPQDAPPYAEE